VTSGGWPARYEIRVEGILEERWSDWFGGLTVENDEEGTLLSGTLPDQPALHGVLEKVRDLGLSVIAVQRLTPEEEEEEE
jgi:hypothetical protein